MIEYGNMSAEDRWNETGFMLPQPPVAGGNYLSAKRVGQMLYLAGVVSSGPDGVMTGTVGADRTVEDGYAGARACALMQMAVIRRELGSLDAVESVVSVIGYCERGGGLRGFAEGGEWGFGPAGGGVRRCGPACAGSGGGERVASERGG